MDKNRIVTNAIERSCWVVLVYYWDCSRTVDMLEYYFAPVVSVSRITSVFSVHAFFFSLALYYDDREDS